jgi:class 3 adenylate cyclase
MALETDVRHLLGAVHIPTLVMHQRGDRAVSVHGGRWLAEQIPDARFLELPGIDHQFWWVETIRDAVASEIEEFMTGVRPLPRVNRVLATVVFTDIVGSTERAADLGDRRWRELLEQHHAMMRRKISEYRGREIDTAGDGFLMSFDGPARGVRCANAIIDDARGLDLEVRAGVHTGECEIMGDKLSGLAVHIGARVAANAGPGEVLISSTVKDLVAGSGLRFADRGMRTLKGVPGEWRIFALAA